MTNKNNLGKGRAGGMGPKARAKISAALLIAIATPTNTTEGKGPVEVIAI